MKNVYNTVISFTCNIIVSTIKDYVGGSRKVLFFSTCTLLLNDNHNIWIGVIDIYGSDTGTNSVASLQKPSTPHDKSHKRPHNQDDDSSLESPQNLPPEDYFKISLNNDINKANQKTLFSVPGYKVKNIQANKNVKITWKKPGEFFCVGMTESETNVLSHIFHCGC